MTLGSLISWGFSHNDLSDTLFETLSFLGFQREAYYIILHFGDVLTFLFFWEGYVTKSFILEMLRSFFFSQELYWWYCFLGWESFDDNRNQISFRVCREVHRIRLHLDGDMNFPWKDPSQTPSSRRWSKSSLAPGVQLAYLSSSWWQLTDPFCRYLIAA